MPGSTPASRPTMLTPSLTVVRHAGQTHRLPPKARRAAAGGCGRMEASERGRGRDSAASHAGGPESRRRERQR